MAKIENGFLGDASGQIGNVVLLRSKNGAIVRSYQPKVFNPKTPGQQSARNNLKLTTQFFSLINTTFIKFLYGISGINKNQFGRAVCDNKNLRDPENRINLNFLKLGIPNCPTIIIKTVTYNAFTDQIDLIYSLPPILLSDENDNFFVSVLGIKSDASNGLELNLNHVCCTANYPHWYCWYNHSPDGYQGANGQSASIHYKFENSWQQGHFTMSLLRRWETQ
jgi:hypothetical protein